MNFKFAFLSTIVLITLAFGTKTNCAENDKTELSSKIEPVTTSLAVSALLSTLAAGGVAVFQGLFQHLSGPTDTQDTILYGRSMKMKICGENCIQITDLASGITVVGTGTSSQEAIGDATKKIFDELLKKGLLSLHELCDLHIHFPHPDQETCPGVEISPCDLIHPIVTTPTPCINKLGDSYCTANAARCKIHLYETLMMSNCLKTCTNGCQPTTDLNANPCKIKP